MGGGFRERGDEVVAVGVQEGASGGGDGEEGARRPIEGDMGVGGIVEGGDSLIAKGWGEVEEMVCERRHGGCMVWCGWKVGLQGEGGRRVKGCVGLLSVYRVGWEFGQY